jgi:hypothetical protein
MGRGCASAFLTFAFGQDCSSTFAKHEGCGFFMPDLHDANDTACVSFCVWRASFATELAEIAIDHARCASRLRVAASCERHEPAGAVLPSTKFRSSVRHLQASLLI